VRSILAICAILLGGCEGSWLYPVPWPDGSDLLLLGSNESVRVWAEPNRIESGVWDPFMEDSRRHAREVLSILEIDEIEKVDVYLHGKCFDPAGQKDCVKLKAQTAGPTLVDLWFGQGYRRRVDLQVSMFRHEFAHAVTAQANEGCPRYLLEEGLAEYARLSGRDPIQPYDVPGTTMDDLAEALASRDGDWIPLGEIVNTGDFLRLLEEGTEGLLYSESGALVEHLVHLGGLDTYFELQERTCVSNEATFHEVFRELYGTDLSAVDKALRNAAQAWE